MKNFFKVIFNFLIGFIFGIIILFSIKGCMAWRTERGTSGPEQNLSIEQLDSLRNQIDRTSVLSSGLSAYPSKKDYNGHSETRKIEPAAGPGMYAIWYPSYGPYKGNDCELMSLGNMVADYKLNMNYIVVVSRAGPVTMDGNWYIQDIDGTIFVGFSIVHKIE